MRDCKEKGVISGLLEREQLGDGNLSDKTGSVDGHFPDLDSIESSDFEFSSVESKQLETKEEPLKE